MKSTTQVDEAKMDRLVEDHKRIKESEVARKIGVFIDQENVFYASLHNANSYPDYKAIMRYVTSIGRVVKAEAVCDWTRLTNSLKFVVGAGIDPVFCYNASTVSDRADSKKQSFADSKIYVDVIELITMDKGIELVVLVAGSRDYIPLVNYLKGKGVFVIVLCEEVSIAWDLKAVADLCLSLQDIDALITAPEKGGGRVNNDESV